MGQQALRHGLIDTDVLVDASRGLSQAGAFLNAMLCGDGVTVSAISAMELIAGCRNGAQLANLSQLLSQFTVVPLTPAIAACAQGLMEAHTLSHGLLLPDVLIAATAVDAGIALYTRNMRHFRMVPQLLIIQPY